VNRDELLASLEQLLAADRPILLVLAGSNGAGKTTFFELYLQSLGLPFVNADVIAQTLSGLDPAHVGYEAAGLAELVRRDLVSQRASFCMETVFSDAAGQKVQFLREAQSAGYLIVFLCFRLSDAALSNARVSQRVARGGHDVPEEKIATRFERTRANVAAALQFVDLGLVIDNSSTQHPFRLVERWERGTCVQSEPKLIR
jgi:predicted ABC-type ATPase